MVKQSRRMGGPKKTMPKTRKEIRKEQRKEKKMKRTLWHERRHHQTVSEVSAPERSSDKKTKTSNGSSIERPKSESTEHSMHQEKLKERKLLSEMRNSRKRSLLAANEEEDRSIRQLGKLLKLNRRGKKDSLPLSFRNDGLDYLLEVCDPNTLKEASKVDQNLHDSGSEFEEDFAVVHGRTKSESNADGNEDSGTDFDEDVDDGTDEVNSDEEMHNTKGRESLKNKSNCKKSKKQNVINNDADEDDEDLESEFGPTVDDSSGGEMSDFDTDGNMLDPCKVAKDETVSITSSGKAKKKLTSANNIKKKSEKYAVSNTEHHEDESSIHSVGQCSDEESSDFESNEDMLDNGNSFSEAEGTSDSESESPNVVVGPHLSKENVTKSKIKIATDGKRKLANNEMIKKSKKTVTFSLSELPKSKNNRKSTVKEPFTSDSEDSGAEDDSECSYNSAAESTDKKNQPKRNADGTWEDIYGRLRDQAGNVVDAKTGKYIPPALRAKMHGDEDAKRKENLTKLRRQVKGLINRLAENNMASICTQIDELFMKNSRNDMNETLLSVFEEALVSCVLTPERLIMEHMLLIAVLHANVGTEVGAHFLQSMIEKFHGLLDNSPAVENKQLDNVLLIISHLYNFKVFTASLMYEVLDKVAETLDEKRIELLLLVLRSVGFSLRKDDPLALKSLILKLQGKAVSCENALGNSSRIKFMLDILMAIKNNNVSKIPSYNPEHAEHLKKLLRTLVRRGNYVAELKITLDDLLKADERGRWWIVGSAWTGHLPGEKPSESASSHIQDSVVPKPSAESSYSTQLLELARKQRMNTGIRKDIFCILMTAEDFLDAFEKLLHLNLKNQQRQEIVHVLFDCCLQEKSFNPYYAHLSQKFCDFDRQYQMNFQYCLWDKLKALDKLQSSQISNMAKLLAHLFLEKGLALSALKVMSFAEMDKPCIRLVRQVLLIILLSEDSSKCDAVFRRIAPSQKLRLFREGLRLFMNHFVLRKSSSGSLPQQDLQLLEERIKLAEKALSSADTRMEF